MQNTYDYKKLTFISGSIALIAIALFAVVSSVATLKTAARGTSPATISISGEGEVIAVPDIATVVFTSRESAKTVPEAQSAANGKTKAALAALSKLSIAEKDTKTISYTINPKYETQMIYCITVPCPRGETVVTGYEVATTIEVKVRKIDQAGEVLGLLGTAGITEVSGTNFTVDDMEAVVAEAKAKAISDAQAKAKKTAKALGVSLGDIVQFSDDNGGYYPVMYGMESARVKSADASSAVLVPQGENVVKSRVTVTYAIN